MVLLNVMCLFTLLAESLRSFLDKSFRVCWRIFVKIFVASTEFCRPNKSHKLSLIWLFTTSSNDKILTKILTKILLYTQGVICRRDVLHNGTIPSFKLTQLVRFFFFSKKS